MQTHLLLREHPRALALRPMMLHEAPSGVLMFEQYTTSLPTTDRAIAKLLPPSEFEDSSWRILNSRPVFGCLGMINLMGGMYGAFYSLYVSYSRMIFLPLPLSLQNALLQLSLTVCPLGGYVLAKKCIEYNQYHSTLYLHQNTTTWRILIVIHPTSPMAVHLIQQHLHQRLLLVVVTTGNNLPLSNILVLNWKSYSLWETFISHPTLT